MTYAPLNAAGIEQFPSNLGADLDHSANAYAMGRSSLLWRKMSSSDPKRATLA